MASEGCLQIAIGNYEVGPGVVGPTRQSKLIFDAASGHGCWAVGDLACGRGVLAVFYFLFSFFTKIYFRFENLQEYTPAALLPGGRDLAVGRQGYF